MGHAVKFSFKSDPWLVFGFLVFLVVYIWFMTGFHGAPWWWSVIYYVIGIGILTPIFFVARRQARINKKLQEKGKSITNVSWKQNIQLHKDERLSYKNKIRNR